MVRPGSLLDRRRSRPAPSEVTIRRIVLASEGRPIPQSVLREVVALAKPEHAEVKVVAIARIWGTSLGFPNPGLQPTRGEWDEQRLSVRLRPQVFPLSRGGSQDAVDQAARMLRGEFNRFINRGMLRCFQTEELIHAQSQNVSQTHVDGCRPETIDPEIKQGQISQDAVE